MTDGTTNAREAFGDVAPKLAEITDNVLFGDVWKDAALSPRDRSLVTIASLISLYRTNELPFHLGKAMENGAAASPIASSSRQTAIARTLRRSKAPLVPTWTMPSS